MAEGEAILLRSVGKQLAAHGQADDVVKELVGTVTLDAAALAAEIRALPEDTRALLFHAAVVVAAADDEAHRTEIEALKTLSANCGVPFDPGDVKREIERLEGVPPR